MIMMFSSSVSGYCCCSSSSSSSSTSSSSSSLLHFTSNIHNSAFNPLPSRFYPPNSPPSRRLLLPSSSLFLLRAVVSLATDESAFPSPSASASDSVSRRLILLRHAHSSFTHPALRDHDRPLTTTGQLDAAKVALKLQQLGWIPQLILLSDAVRTRETLKIMQENVPAFLDAQVRFVPSFYSVAAMDGQTAEHLQLSVCKHSTNDILTVMCMGHNKGWEEAASMFTGTTVELQSCNAALLEATGKSWEEAFASAGLGGWKLKGIVKPSNGLVV